MQEWKEIERSFEYLLGNVSGVISGKDAEEVRHFLDAKEYGVALETLIDILIEGEGVCGESDFRLIKEMLKTMGMSDERISD